MTDSPTRNDSSSAYCRAEQREREERRDPDHPDLDQLAAEILRHLQIHFTPDLGTERLRRRQVGLGPVQNPPLVLEQEEHQNRHDDRVHHDRQHVHHRVQGKADDLVRECQHLRPHCRQDLFHLNRANQFRIKLRERLDPTLSRREHARQPRRKIHDLLRQHRHQAQQQQQQDCHEQDVDQQEGEQPRDPGLLQRADQPLEYVGQKDADQKRRQDVADEQGQGQPQADQQQQDDLLRIREMPPVPFAEHLDHAASSGAAA